MIKPRYRALFDWLAPLVVLVGLTVPFWTTDLDVDAARRFYDQDAGWPRGGEPPWKQLRDYGVIPAWVVALSALGVLAASFSSARCRRHRRSAAFLVVVMAMGPGLLVNDVFKENWGRPRPRDVTVFGGERDYVAPLVKRPKEQGNSFASGHAATGYYLATPYFLWRGRRRGHAAWVFAIGVAYGSAIGLARMMQGAHFLSDVLWAFGLVYLSALAAAYVLRIGRDSAAPARVPSERAAASAIT